MGLIKDSALEYIANGWPVIPLFSVYSDGSCFCADATCKSAGKHPRPDLAPNAVHSATLDPAVVAT